MEFPGEDVIALLRHNGACFEVEGKCCSHVALGSDVLVLTE